MCFFILLSIDCLFGLILILPVHFLNHMQLVVFFIKCCGWFVLILQKIVFLLVSGYKIFTDATRILKEDLIRYVLWICPRVHRAALQVLIVWYDSLNNLLILLLLEFYQVSDLLLHLSFVFWVNLIFSFILFIEYLINQLWFRNFLQMIFVFNFNHLKRVLPLFVYSLWWQLLLFWILISWICLLELRRLYFIFCTWLDCFLSSSSYRFFDLVFYFFNILPLALVWRIPTCARPKTLIEILFNYFWYLILHWAHW